MSEPVDASPFAGPRPLDWLALWDEPDDFEEYLVRPVIGQGRLVALYSAPGVGKSLLALEWAAALAAGKPVMGLPTRPTSVLYVDFENDPRGDVIPRLKDMGYQPRDLERLHFYSFPALQVLDTHAGGLQLHALAIEHAVSLVIIDTVSRTVQGEENENDTWLNFYRCTAARLKRDGIACLRLDHTGKDETKGQRGASAKSGDVDAVWRLTRATEGRYRLLNEKSRQQLPPDDRDLLLQRETDPVLRHLLVTGERAMIRASRVQELVEHLDRMGVPTDAGRPTAKRALDAAGVKASNSDLCEAIRARRAVRTAPGQPPLDILPDHPPDSHGQDGPKPRQDAEQHCPSHITDSPGQPAP